ncbi:hypothetical protein CYMTET_37403 [Cymbomonas tetramitiformis]|uniref:Uncharacterized protein n=1 Tax=Cymbomonas tetramitiformis TaxID=36881 RepID=A0AAE0F6J1_9CHLO|nr:hypothetical protein CYMTET_37403 [Cymbomonas tetramitiformis]
MKRHRSRTSLPPEAERLVARVREMDSVDEMGMRRMVRDHHPRKNRGIKRCYAIVDDIRDKKQNETQCPDPCEHCTTSRSRSDCSGAKGFWYFMIMAAIARPSSGDDDADLATNTPIANIIQSCQRWQKEVARLTRMLLNRMYANDGVRSESKHDIKYRIGNYIAIAYLKIAERYATRSKTWTTRDVEDYVVAHFFRVVERKPASDRGGDDEFIRNIYGRSREVSGGVITRYRIYTEHLNTGNTIALERDDHQNHPRDAYWPRFILISLPQLMRALWKSGASRSSSKQVDLIQLHYIKLPERWRRQRRFEFLQLENLTLQCTLYRPRIRDTPAQHEGRRSFLQRCEECIRLYSRTPDRFRELTWDRRHDVGAETTCEERQMKLEMAGTRSRLPTIDIKSSKLIQFCYRTAVALSHDDTIREAGAFVDDDILRLCDHHPRDVVTDDDDDVVEGVDDDTFMEMLRSQIRTCVRLFAEDDNLTRGITKADSSLYHRRWSPKGLFVSSSMDFAPSKEREDAIARSDDDDDDNDDNADGFPGEVAIDRRKEDDIETPRKGEVAGSRDALFVPSHVHSG